MKSVNLSGMLNSFIANVKQHNPEILTGIGIAGMITTTVLAVKATPKAIILLEERKKESKGDDLPPVEVIKTAWKCYIPTVATGTLSITCIIFAQVNNSRRNAALATAYSLSESALKTYQEKVIETIGEKKEQAIRDEIAKDKVEANPVVNNEVIITGNGEALCLDTISQRYFKCDIEKIRKTVNNLNFRLMSEMYVSLNDFYAEIGLKTTQQGDILGWNIDSGLIEIKFSSQVADNGMPCLVLEYQIEPRYDYRSLH